MVGLTANTSIKQILFITLVMAFPIVSFATDYYTAKTGLNVRSSIGTRYSVSFTLKKGDEVEFLSKEKKSWFKIKHLGKTGYVNSKYLKFKRSISSTKSDENAHRVIDDKFLVLALAIFAAYIGFTVYRKMRYERLLKSVTNKNRGTKSERDLVLKLLKFGIPKENIFHDLYVEKRKTEFSQSDLVVVTEVGILVFEVKDYSGWIFGIGNQTQWTQLLAYGKRKYQFYNPIMQNNTHIAELRRKLFQFEHLPFYSIVVFYGDNELKSISLVPDGTFVVKAKRVIQLVRDLLTDSKSFVYTDETEVIRILREAVKNGENIENQIQHSKNINDMLSKQVKKW